MKKIYKALIYSLAFASSYIIVSYLFDRRIDWGSFIALFLGFSIAVSLCVWFSKSKVKN